MLLTWYCLQFFSVVRRVCPLKKQDPHNPSLHLPPPHLTPVLWISCSPSRTFLHVVTIQLNRQPAAQSLSHASPPGPQHSSGMCCKKSLGEPQALCFSPAHTLHTLLEIWTFVLPPHWSLGGLETRGCIFCVCVCPVSPFVAVA